MAVLRKVFSKDGKSFVYYMDFRLKGRRIVRSIKSKDRNIAKMILGNIQGDIARGRFGIKDVEEEKNISIADFKKLYIDTCSKVEKEKTTVDIDRRALSALEQHFGKSRTLRSINKAAVGPFRAELIGHYSATSVNMYMRQLRAAWNWAMAIEPQYVSENIFKGVKQFSVPETRPRYMTPEEVTKLFEALHNPPKWGPGPKQAKEMERLVRFLLCVASRRTESILLRWKDIDLERRMVFLEKTKTDKWRGVPINDELKGLLEEMKADVPDAKPEDQLFNFKDASSASKAFRRYADRAGLSPSITLHSTRHTAATEMLRRGAGLLALKDYLGHSSLSTTLIYGKIVPETLVQISVLAGANHMIEEGEKKLEEEKKAS